MNTELIYLLNIIKKEKAFINYFIEYNKSDITLDDCFLKLSNALSFDDYKILKSSVAKKPSMYTASTENNFYDLSVIFKHWRSIID